MPGGLRTRNPLLWLRGGSDEQLRQGHSWLLKNNLRMSREALEKVGNKWELARQMVNRVPIGSAILTRVISWGAK